MPAPNDVNCGVGNGGGIEGDVGHLRRIVRILEGAPELRVGHVHGAGDLLEELLSRNLIAVVRLELGEDALLLGHRARDEPTVLLEVELALEALIGRVRDVDAAGDAVRLHA